MIFATTGTRSFPFTRFVKALDHAAFELGLPKEEIFAQIGTSLYKPKYMEYAPFLDKTLFEEKMQKCHILVTHAAAGTMISGMRRHKKIIVLPRLAQYGEHIDDHQMELAGELARQNLIFCLKDISCLAEQIKEISNRTFNKYTCNPHRMVALIEAEMGKYVLSEKRQPL